MMPLTGGQFLDAVLLNGNEFCRVAVCGIISTLDKTEDGEDGGWAGENIDDSSTSFFVNSRTLMGCRNGGRRTPSVPSRFGSKLPHLC